MNNGKERVKLSKVIQKMNLVNLTPVSYTHLRAHET